MSTRRSWLRRIVLGLLGAFALMSVVTLAFAWRGLGTAAKGARLARMQRSPQWKDGGFVNPQTIVNHYGVMLDGLMHVSEYVAPKTPLHPVRTDARALRSAPATGLRVTWMGHSSNLVEIDGVRLLTDPVWSRRPSPVSWIGPTRWFEPTIALADLPRIEAVIISHDHYDHLDQPTVVALSKHVRKFIVPLGVGADLEYWGIAPSQIIELDWWERTPVGGVEVVCTPARHASGRHVFDRDDKLWASYALIGPSHRVYFSGDTGLFPAMREIGERLGPFDLTMIETGQYDAAWPDWHIGPEQAVRAHQMLKGRVMLPVHWSLLALAYHGWTEPVERTLAEARLHDVVVATPRPGESFEPTALLPSQRWWPQVPWKTAAEHPIVSSQVD